MILKVNQKKSELFIQYHFNSDNSCENPYVRCDSFNSLFGSITTYQLTLPVQHITVLFMFDYKQKYSWISEIPFGYKITTKGFFFFPYIHIKVWIPASYHTQKHTHKHWFVIVLRKLDSRKARHKNIYKKNYDDDVDTKHMIYVMACSWMI